MPPSILKSPAVPPTICLNLKMLTSKQVKAALIAGFLFLGSGQALAKEEVRVLVLEDVKTITVSVSGDYTIKLLPSQNIFKKGHGLVYLPIAGSKNGILIDGVAVPTRGIRVEPVLDRDLFLNEYQFRGSLDILKNEKDDLAVVNGLDMESYLYGVLPHEVASWWPLQALKAQSVAARTYARYEMSKRKKYDYDLKSDTSSQVYKGSGREKERTNRAVNQTAGKVLTYEGKLFPTYFHATCGGQTAAAQELWDIELPPLAGGQKCSYCRISPHFDWKSKLPLAAIEQIMIQNKRPVGQILGLEIITQTPSGRAGSIRVKGTTGVFIMAAKDFRIWVGGNNLRSTNFTVSIKDDEAIFVGKGWGHGVGLCQWGALGQALLGKSYQEILTYYYPGSKIETS